LLTLVCHPDMPSSPLLPSTPLFRAFALTPPLGARRRRDRLPAQFGNRLEGGPLMAGIALDRSHQLRDQVMASGQLDIDVGPCGRSEEHTSELQSRENIVCRLLLDKK